MAASSGMLVLIALMALSVSVTSLSVVKVHSYLDAFCGTEQTTELYNANTCHDNGEGSYSMYIVDDKGVSHCEWSNAACIGESIRCVKDARVSGKCYQTSTTTSKKFEFDSAPAPHSLSFVEQASSSSSARSSTGSRRSSTGRPPVYSSTGSAQPISGLTLTLYRNSSYCNYVSSSSSNYYYVDRCYSPSETVIKNYYERVTVTSGTGDNTRGIWCRYNGWGSGCTSTYLIGCTSFMIGTCTTDGVTGRDSVKFSYGIDLAGLAAVIIVLIVIGALILVGSVVTACCCGAAAAALLGRLCCGLCCTGRPSAHQGYVQHSTYQTGSGY